MGTREWILALAAMAFLSLGFFVALPWIIRPLMRLLLPLATASCGSNKVGPAKRCPVREGFYYV